MYNPNSPSNWSWSKAFKEMEKTVNRAECTQQIVNHLTIIILVDLIADVIQTIYDK